MQVISQLLIQNKIILLRFDLDVPFSDGQVSEDFRLRAGLPTLRMCLGYGKEVIIMGHIGRPEGRVVPNLSVEPIYDWLTEQGFKSDLENKKLRLLENLRFENGEDEGDLIYAKKLAGLGEIYINEAFAAHHPASSTTILPALLPHGAGLHFAQEVEELTKVRNYPQHPLAVIVGGIKIEDKLPALLALEKTADDVLVGGKISEEMRKHPDILQSNIYLAKLNQDGLDLTEETIKGWSKIISSAKMVVWNGPLGKTSAGEKQSNLGEMGTEKGTYEIAQAIISSRAESIVGGGDTVEFLSKYKLLDKFSFVSTGGGAMLKFLAEGTLPTIKALE